MPFRGVDAGLLEVFTRTAIPPGRNTGDLWIPHDWEPEALIIAPERPENPSDDTLWISNVLGDTWPVEASRQRGVSLVIEPSTPEFWNGTAWEIADALWRWEGEAWWRIWPDRGVILDFSSLSMFDQGDTDPWKGPVLTDDADLVVVGTHAADLEPMDETGTRVWTGENYPPVPGGAVSYNLTWYILDDERGRANFLFAVQDAENHIRVTVTAYGENHSNAGEMWLLLHEMANGFNWQRAFGKTAADVFLGPLERYKVNITWDTDHTVTVALVEADTDNEVLAISAVCDEFNDGGIGFEPPGDKVAMDNYRFGRVSP